MSFQQKINLFIWTHEKPGSLTAVLAAWNQFRNFQSWKSFREIILELGFDIPTKVMYLEKLIEQGYGRGRKAA